MLINTKCTDEIPRTPLEERFDELDYYMWEIINNDEKNPDILRMHCEKEKIRDFLDKGQTSVRR